MVKKDKIIIIADLDAQAGNDRTGHEVLTEHFYKTNRNYEGTVLLDM
jgi:hypothetical protein